MAKKSKSNKEYNPHESVIIQAGVIVIIVSAIALFAAAYSQYTLK